MRWTVGCVLLVVASAAAGWLLGRRPPGTSPGSTSSTHTGPTIEQVRELSELVTIRVDVADVQETSVSGQLGGLRVALIVKGDFLLGVDLSHARFDAVDEVAKTAVIVLPAPRATSPRVDHDRTRVVQVSDEGLWAVVPGDAGRGRIVDRAYAEAQRTVAGVAGDPVLADRARGRAEQVLGAFFRVCGWTVQVRWES